MTALESLPNDWELLTISQIGEIYSGATPSTNVTAYWNGDIVWITPNDLSKRNTRFIETSERKITAQGIRNCSAHLLPAKSLVISSRAPIGYLALPTTDFCTNQGCKSLVFDDHQEPEFHYYNFSFRVRQIREKGEGTTFAEISKTALGQIKFPVPKDKRTQAKIAEMLTAVDHTIAQTEALIAKYQRIKTGLMQDLLTRGIDENGNLRHPDTHEFKDSQLGRTPTEWKLHTLEQLSSRITSGSRGWAKFYSVTGAKFIRIGNLIREHVHLDLHDIQHVMPPSGSEGKRTSLETGDLLISVTADLGIIGVVPEGLGEAYINQHIALIKLDKNIANPWWVGSFLSGQASQKQFTQLNESGAKAGLNLSTVASIPVPMPNLQEQNNIVQILQKADDRLNIEKENLAKLQRIKTGLMQDLLTGKVSVAPLLDRSTEGAAS